MTETTVELDTTQEEAPSQNGHDEKWQTFASDEAFLQHILSKEPAEEEVEVPEWGVKVLCKALSAEARIEVQSLSFDAKTGRTNYAPYTHLITLYGSYNPTTGKRAFSKEHEAMLKDPKHGGAVVRLAFTILRLSGMLFNDVEQAKKNRSRDAL